MNYQILNHLGEELLASVSQEQLDEMIETGEFNMFQWDATEESNIITGLAVKKAEEPESDFSTTRIYKLIEE